MSALMSLGYEGRTLDEVVNLCLGNLVGVLVDVRLNPISRKPGLSKSALGAGLRDAGVRYLHLPDLGNPKDNRDAFAADDTVNQGRERFRAVLATPASEAALLHVSRLLESNSVALLCFERDHVRCHRSVVVEAIERLHAVYLEPCHL